MIYIIESISQILLLSSYYIAILKFTNNIILMIKTQLRRIFIYFITKYYENKRKIALKLKKNRINCEIIK